MNTFRKQKVLIFVIALVLLLYILNIQELNIFSLSGHRRSPLTQQYIINTTGCRIPFLDINDEEIMNLLDKPDPSFTCGIPLVYSNLTSLFLDQNAFKYYGIVNVDDINCSFQPFWRIDPKGQNPDIDVKYGKVVPFHLSTNVNDEFVRVKCFFNGHKHTDFHSFVPKKKPMSNLNTQRAIHDEKLNVYILGIDSLSRLHFHRKMPKTSEYLLKELKAIEYFGYNKLSDNTFPNLIPAFTSYSFEELIKVCWPNYQTKFDNCSFVFQNYTKEGYIVNFGEEESYFGVFNYLKKGWKKQPTDYYWKTFDYTALAEVQHTYDLANNYPKCMSKRPMYKVLLQHGEKFIKTMYKNRFFSFLWTTSLAHNHLDTATLGDYDFLQHLIFLNKSGILNNTILIFMSDHGYRFGKIVRTHQGHLEERLPYIFFVLPSWFQKKYPIAFENMKNNAYRLTTPFDLHSTLNNILHPEELKDEFLVNKIDNGERNVSLFHPISPERTCESANIPTHWCTCQESLPVDKTDPVVLKVAKYSVSVINDKLKNYKQCAFLNLIEITHANLAKYGDMNHDIKISTSDYEIMFRTDPGGGWFGATVRCTYCDDSDFILSGTISRLNKYGNSSYCINDFNLKLYCYCEKTGYNNENNLLNEGEISL